MTKITLLPIESIISEQSFINRTNQNYTEIQTKSDSFLSRDGSSPNTMESDLDMNDNHVLNLPEPVDATSPVRLTDIPDLIADIKVGPQGPQGIPGELVTSGSVTAGNMAVFVNSSTVEDGGTPFDGDYESLTNLPELFDGDYESLSNLPDLHAVATTGDYDDLENKPTLGNSSSLDIGTGSGTVAAGNDTRIVNALQANTADQTITGGARVTSLSLGTITSGTLTPDPGDRPLQHYTNNGAHTLAPGSNKGYYVLQITNASSAGAITTSSWTLKAGDDFTTTNGHKFICSCLVHNDYSLLIVKALQ